MMMNNYTYTPRAYHNFVNKIVSNSEQVAPRGLRTSEMTNVQLVTRDLQDRVVTDQGRRMNLGFAVAEWVAMMVGIDDIDFFIPHIKSYDKYSSDGIKLDGAYGGRVVNLQNGSNQIMNCVGLLLEDPDTRQAIISIYNNHDAWNTNTKNKPCTLSIQFLVRNNKLDAYTMMRSNDIFRGLTYDWFVFTLIHEFISMQLDIELGTYHHWVGSLHLYQSDEPELEKMTRRRWPWTMSEMSETITYEEVKLLSTFMKDINNGKSFDDVDSYQFLISPICKEFFYIHCAMVLRHVDKLASYNAFKKMNDQTLRHVVLPFLRSAEVYPRSSH